MRTGPSAGGARADGNRTRTTAGISKAPPIAAGAATGLCRLLDDAAESHGLAVSAATEIAFDPRWDMSARRGGPVVVSGVVDGRVEAFGGDAPAHVTTEIAPGVANGWRSVTTLNSARGDTLTIELLATCAASGDGCARCSGAAAASAACRPRGSSAEARRWRELRARARAAFATAEAAPWPSVVERGPAVASLGHIASRLEHAARAALPAPARGWTAVRREMHLDGTVEDGDILALASEMTLPLAPSPTAPPRDLAIFTVARREPDGTVVAVGQTRFEPASGSCRR